MKHRSRIGTVLIPGIIVLLAILYILLPSFGTEDIVVSNPFDGAVFPPEIAAPTFRWDDRLSGAGNWRIIITFKDGDAPVTTGSKIMEWRPDNTLWETIKRRSLSSTATVTISGVRSSLAGAVLSRFKPVSRRQLTFSTSPDSVGAPILYRDVPLPFDFAREKMELIQWRLGDISKSERPPVILENLPVCGNCHSFNHDGTIFGMDVDSGGDKGSYAVTPVEKEIYLSRDKLITWSDYRREDGETTFGLLAELSPDGKYVASAVKDRVIFITREKLMFSQLFFPVKGIVAIYNRSNNEIKPLPGADNPDLVQANPVWSPDGKYIIFARNKVTDYVKNDYTKNAVLTRQQSAVVLGGEKYLEDSEGGETFCFDLYRIPFNDGKGGIPEPVPGASNNGKSNYFAAYSPDGKWIVFCQARSFMLLQPDSQLYIMPADFSVPPRLMNCNTTMMNSRHSWSPNGRWLVFSSKINGAYTDLYLTHVDENGIDSRPVLIESFSSTDRARNIPIFAPIAQGGIAHIYEAFVDYYSYVRKGYNMTIADRYDDAEEAFRTSIELNPDFALSHSSLGTLLYRTGRFDEAKKEFETAYRLAPKDAGNCTNIGLSLLKEKKTAEARRKFTEAIQYDNKYGTAYQGLGISYYDEGNDTKAEEYLKQAVSLNPELADAHYYLGILAMKRNDLVAAGEAFQYVLRKKADTEALTRLGEIDVQSGRIAEAESNFLAALKIDAKNMGALHNLGIVYMTRKEYAKAEEAFKTVYAANPANPNACFMLATVYGLRQETAGQAIELYKKGLSLAPRNIQGYIDLGNLYLKTGRENLAREEFGKALELKPDDAQLREMVQRLGQTP
jgi:Flp pilus assembly protein TadD